jgi:hypothetical protein
MAVQKDRFAFNQTSVKIFPVTPATAVASQRGLSAGVTSFKPQGGKG